MESTTAPKVRSAAKHKLGHVSFVGVGPGDAGLLTVRGAELIKNAQIILIERPEHRELVTNDAQVVEAGPDLTPAQRARLITKAAKDATHVVRLVDGDPFVYGFGPEEAAACEKAGIGFDVIPGVSKVNAIPVYAGIPLTTKNQDRVSVIKIDDSVVDWNALDKTVVAFSNTNKLENFVAGTDCDPETPVSITTNGTTIHQVTVVTTLRDLPNTAKNIEAPFVMVIGEVVAEREALSWFETKPLFGWRVLVPRTKEPSAAMISHLNSYGAVCEEVPTISVEPPRNPQQMDKAIRGLVEGRYEWIAFTSANAVKAVREKLEEYGLDARAFSGLKIAAVGEKTVEMISQWGIRPDLVPTGEQTVKSLYEQWPPYDSMLDPINRVFLPRADIATETLVAGLIELGWEVDDITAYRTVRAAPPPAPTREAIKAGRFDAVLFTSSSTVRNLVGIAGKPHPTTIIACIGPATAKTAEENGLRVDVIAAEPLPELLADELAEFAIERREKLLAAGDPITKPSDRRSSRRKS